MVGEVYHVFNRAVARQPVFLGKRYYDRVIETIFFYSFTKPRLRFSHYNRLPLEQRAKFLKELKDHGEKLISLKAYSLMPNHFHFLIKQTKEKGISTFMRNFQDSYAKYFNIKNSRIGSLFQSMFKAVRIESDEQLIHVARYIHLNPLTSYVIKDFHELETYPWTSFPAYIKNSGEKDEIIDREEILSHFSSIESFKKFTLDQLDYQRKLEKIKHLTIENP